MIEVSDPAQGMRCHRLFPPGSRVRLRRTDHLEGTDPADRASLLGKTGRLESVAWYDERIDPAGALMGEGYDLAYVLLDETHVDVRGFWQIAVVIPVGDLERADA